MAIDAGWVQLDNYRIYVADDDLVCSTLIKRVLSAKQAIVTCFSDGKRLMGALEKKTADLIIVDNQMPNMSGMAVLEIMKKDQRLRDIPVIMLSGSNFELSDYNALEIKADAYVAKPIDLNEFYSALSTIQVMTLNQTVTS